MTHPNTELKFISDVVGYGVVTTAFAPAGTITWVLAKFDREFTPDEVKNLDPINQNILDTYTYINNNGNYVFCWDIGHFVNHSFKSNCLTTAYDFEIAIRDIQPGEELTDDYGYLNISKPFKGINEGTKRKTVYPDDLLKYDKVWDKKIEKVFTNIVKHEQPLKVAVNEDLWLKIENIIKGKQHIDSFLNNHYSG
jgi:hypothetical protein